MLIKGCSMDLENVVEKALEFHNRKAGYYFAQLLSAKLEDSIWVLEFDVGILTRQIVVVKIDDKTGKVVGFEWKSRENFESTRRLESATY